MADKAPSSSRPTQSSTSVEDVDWNDAVPLAIDQEDTMNPRKVALVWEKVYAKAKLRNPSESTQRALRLAVYAYGCINGTSREGEYAGTMTLANGMVVPASVIPTSTGKNTIRNFFRGNMYESYHSMKGSKVMEQQERYVAKMGALGIAAEQVFATADWMGSCPYFTPAEAKAHQAAFNHSIKRARRARDGKTLEGVEAERLEEELDAQGPARPDALSGREF